MASSADWLEGCLARSPSKTVYTFLADGGGEVAKLTYAELESQTRALARSLLSPSTTRPALRPGDRVLLVYLPSLDFIVAFIACLRAGLVAVPTYPPDPQRSKANFGAFATIARDCGAQVALTHRAYSQLSSLAALQDASKRIFGLFSRASEESGASRSPALQWPDWLAWVQTDGLTSGSSLALAAAAPPVADDALAFLQYTSGSTAEPKGVMISRSNLRHNLETIVRSLAASDGTVVVSWLPQYHDMGLIGEDEELAGTAKLAAVSAPARRQVLTLACSFAAVPGSTCLR